jgi:hypothetical protein
LDDILKKIDPTGAMGEEAIGRIMGYNSFLRKSGIQHTCADCFYLTYGVKFIKLKYGKDNCKNTQSRRGRCSF